MGASDWASKRFGMRGRLWCLWLWQTTEGVMCIFMALAKDDLATTIVMMVLFSICVQASEGASYGIVPYITRRALGVASGFIGAGGNAGSTICIALFFTSDSIEEDYYIKNDFSPEEIKQGLAAPVQKFCNNAHMERPPSKRTGSESA